MLINAQYFTHPDTRIAGIDTESDGKPAGPAPQLIADITSYIQQYEPVFLEMLLGREAARNIDKYPDIKALLVQPDKGTSVIAKYVYFMYARDHVSFNTVAGEKIKRTPESSSVLPNSRLVMLWNDMVDECWHIISTIKGSVICPVFCSDIFEKINGFNL